MSTNNLTVLILAAGYGRRMGPFSRMINKSLVPYKDKPLISHIIDKFPKETTKFVVACGHMGQQVKDYVSSVHDDKCIVFVDIPDYSEANTGPATTIQHCAQHILNGFLWISCDTLFEFDYADKLDHNWIGVYPVDSYLAKDYCWIERNGENIDVVYNKIPSTRAVDAFIGLMYCKDDQYLDQLISSKARETPEGFHDLGLKAHTVREWLDFGTYDKWHEINGRQQENSFVKPDEIFYHDNGRVVKYFSKEEHVTSRIRRAQANPECMPTNMKAAGNFLIHDWTDGDIIYNQLTPALFRKMLDWCDTNIWVDPEIDENTQPLCEKFYKDKTLERWNQFRIKYADWSECCVVNRREVDSIDNYLSKIDWAWLCRKREWTWIHGDLHFDNTVYNAATDKFTAIDWRTDFAGSVYGDMYYDLAKMLGGIWLNYRSIKDKSYDYLDRNDYATIEIPSVDNAQVYEDILQGYVNKKGLEWRKVKLLVPLIYLNMSPLHEAPFDKFLVALAQLHFSQVL